MNPRIDKLFALLGPAALLPIFAATVWAHLLPPPKPLESPEVLAAFYAQYHTRILWAMFIGMLGAALLLPWGAVMTKQVRRMTGPGSAAVYMQLGSAALIPLEIIACFMFLATAAFRPDRNPEITELMSDLGWIWAVGIVFTFLAQVCFLAWLILSDKSVSPLYPRWSGYLHLFVAVTQVFGGMSVVFDSGPLAWNGMLAFWLAVPSWGVYVLAMGLLTVRAIDLPDPHPAEIDLAVHEAKVVAARMAMH